MALNRFSKSLSMAKRCLISSFSYRNSHLFLNRNLSTNLTSFVSKLLQNPIFSSKEALDSEEKCSSSVFKSQDFSWDSLIISLKSSPKKANLVVEWRLDKLLKENVRNQDSYSELIRLCGEIQNVETALRIFSSMEAQELKPNSSVFNALISVCLSSHNFVTALSLFELMESSEVYRSDSETYNAFIKAYANLGNKKAMQAWYSAKIAAGFSVDLQTYDYLILGCVKSKTFDDAQNFYEEMTVAGFIPNLFIMQNMLVVYRETRNLGKIKEYMKYATDGSWYIDKLTVVKVMNLFDELGGVKDMEELLVTCIDLNQTLEVLSLVHSAIIRMYCRINRLDDVEYSVGRMLKQGISFKSSEDIEKVISLYFRQAAYDRLDLFLKCIKDSYKFTRSTYDLLVSGYRRAGLQEKLDLLKNDMKLDGFFTS